MKATFIVLLALVVAVGCGKAKTETKTETQSPEEKLVGSYEAKRAGTTLRYVFLEDRMFEVYMNDERKDGGTWRALGNEVFLEDKSHTLVCKIEPSGYLTEIAYIQNGKRNLKICLEKNHVS